MKILWAEKMANEVNGSYEYFIDSETLKMDVRIYVKEGIHDVSLKRIKKQIPKDFSLCGIYYCKIEKMIFLLIIQK